MNSLLLAAAVGYLLGSLPFGWFVARLHGVNIFEVGSKSPGATNVGRAVGPGARNLVFALDAAKGALAAGWPLIVVTYFPAHAGSLGLAAADGPDRHSLVGVVSLVAALVGHSFSCFTRFRGGKGVASGAGGFLVLLPLSTLISAAVWLVVFLVSRYVSLASICSALALPLAAWLLGRSPSLTTVAAAACAFVIWRHRANIVRLLQGTENRSGPKG